MIPETNNTWVAELQRRYPTGFCNEPDYFDLISRRPIVTWFSNQKKSIHRLIKVTARTGDDLWIVSSINEGGGETLFLTNAKPLLTSLNYPQIDCGWILCEFPNQIAFYEAALAYLNS